MSTPFHCLQNGKLMSKNISAERYSRERGIWWNIRFSKKGPSVILRPTGLDTIRQGDTRSFLWATEPVIIMPPAPPMSFFHGRGFIKYAGQKAQTRIN